MLLNPKVRYAMHSLCRRIATQRNLIGNRCVSLRSVTSLSIEWEFFSFTPFVVRFVFISLRGCFNRLCDSIISNVVGDKLDAYAIFNSFLFNFKSKNWIRTSSRNRKIDEKETMTDTILVFSSRKNDGKNDSTTKSVWTMPT